MCPAAPSSNKADASALLALQQKWLATRDTLGEDMSAAPALRAKVDRLEVMVMDAMRGAVARNAHLEEVVAELQAEKAVLEAHVGMEG